MNHAELCTCTYYLCLFQLRIHLLSSEILSSKYCSKVPEIQISPWPSSSVPFCLRNPLTIIGLISVQKPQPQDSLSLKNDLTSLFQPDTTDLGPTWRSKSYLCALFSRVVSGVCLSLLRNKALPLCFHSSEKGNWIYYSLERESWNPRTQTVQTSQIILG